jgi:cyanophycinase
MNRSSVPSTVVRFLERLFHFTPDRSTPPYLESQFPGEKMPQSTKTAIMVIGGAEDKVHGREILYNFFGRSGSTDAQIAIIPSASREPAIIGDRYQKIFEEMGAKGIEILDIQDRTQCDDPLMQSYVESCTGCVHDWGRPATAV